jgi:catechol 2,3-dioxygenase-like lactoylglutathione lyase family enzyme
MFTHIAVGSNDLPRSRRFYDALFDALGEKPAREDDRGRLVYFRKGAMLIVGPPLDGEPAAPGNGMTIGLAADGPEQVDALHRAGLTAGDTTAEDPPGIRQGSVGPVYLAYLRDPDGNKLCAAHRLPA